MIIRTYFLFIITSISFLQRKYDSLNNNHIKLFFEDKRVSNIKALDINDFIVQLKNKELSEKTINDIIGLVGAVFSYGVDNELAINNPCIKIKSLRIPHKEKKICALTWDKVDFVAKKILVNKSMYKNTIQETKTETSIRKVDMTDSLIKVLKKHRANSQLGEYIFWGQKGTPLSGDATLWRHFNSITTKAGLKDITFHDLKHTFSLKLNGGGFSLGG